MEPTEPSRRPAGEEVAGDGAGAPVRVWLVERTYSDDELNIVILVYATPDGERYLRKELALTSADDDREVTAAVDAAPSNLGRVEDPDRRERYAAEARRMRAEHDPEDAI